MHSKKLKYQAYLIKYDNCPPESYQEVEITAYRWTHNNICKNDFTPINLINKPPQRMFDETDKMCMGYGLSLFDTRSNALNRYVNLYQKKRKYLKMKFIEDFGNSISEIEIKTENGIGNKPNVKNFGHFTFHEYEKTNFVNNIICQTEILITKDGTIKK